MNTFYTKYKIPVFSILIIIILGGLYSLRNIQVGLFPDITFPKVKIIAENGDQPVEKMMVTTTIPIENAIKKVEDLELIRSTTSRGSCEISAFLAWKSDTDLGKQRIEAQINQIKETLPAGVKITIEKMNPSILPVMGFSLEGNRSQIELRQIAEYNIKPALSRVAGVSEVAVIGGKVKEYHILLDANKMSQLGITPNLISSSITQSNLLSSGGYLQDYNRLYLTLTDAAVTSKDQLENLVIQNSTKRIVRIKDVAKVEIGELQEYVKINANGKNVPLIAILKQPKANLIETVKGVQAQLAELQKTLPPGVTLRPYYDQADFVKDAIGSLRDVLWIGLLLALIVAFMFLRSVKAGSVILFTIPVTLSITIGILYSIGYTLNIMTIGAFAAAIGLIIDDAIVVVEQIHRTHEEFPSVNSFELVHRAIKYLFPALVGSSLSTIVIFLPFFLMGGVSGAYFRVMTNTMIITLTSSFFVTWIGLPVTYIIFSKETHSIQSTGKEVKRRNWVYYFVERPFLAVSFAIALIAISLFIMPRLPSGFLPEMDEGSIVLDYTSPPGSSLDETDKMLKNVDKILYETPEVESFSRRTGTQMGFFITEQNYGDYLIKLKNKRDKTTDEVSDVIRKRIESSLPALRVDFGQVIGDMLGDLMASVQPIEVKVFGPDNQKLQEIAKEVASVVEETKGTADVFNGITIAGPEINFEPDPAKLAQYQLSPQDFQSQLQSKIEGTVVSNILESNRTVDIRMIEKGYQHDLNDIKNASIFLPDGKLKPLTEFANVKFRPGVAQIERENLQSMVAVTARLNNRDLGATLKDIKKQIEAKIHVPAGYSIEYGGAYAEQQKAFDELLTILFAALLLIFVVILFLFKKIKVAFAIIFIAILGISGSILALFITGTPLNVGSYTGIIMIVGIIGENSIFTYLQYQASRNGGEKRDDAIAYSISTRLRPKLMTALGAICALFPLALGVGVGAQMHQPLAIAIIGGLLIGLPLLLIVLPTMLHLLED